MADCLKANLPSFIAQSPEQATAQRSTSPIPEMYQQTAYSLFHCCVYRNGQQPRIALQDMRK